MVGSAVEVEEDNVTPALADVADVEHGPNEEVASEIMSEIIDDVLKSTSAVPSVASVVFDTFKDYVAPPEAEDDNKEESLPYDIAADIEAVLDTGEDLHKKYAIVEEPEILESHNENSQVISEAGDVDEISVSSMSRDGAAASTQENKEVNISVDTGDKLVQISHDVEEFKTEEPASGNQDLLTAPGAVPTAVPQTDLDTFETRMCDEISNLDDDSDKRSDSGSVNTVDSVGDSQEPENAEVTQRQPKKGHIRQRNVSLTVVLSEDWGCMSI